MVITTALLSCVYILDGHIQHLLLGLGVAMSAVGLCVMTLSFLYFAGKSVFTRSSGRFCTRFASIFVIAAWLALVAAVGAMAILSSNSPERAQVIQAFYLMYGLLIAFTVLRFASGYFC